MRLDSYSPIQNGAGANVSDEVYYSERAARGSLREIVHCFWTLKTTTPLEKTFMYTIMPDACIDIVVSVDNITTPIVMTPTIAIETLELGKTFHYIGIRFKPGVFKSPIDIEAVIGKQQDLADFLRQRVELSKATLCSNQSEQAHYEILEQFVHELYDAGIVRRNIFIETILTDMYDGLSIDEIATKVGYSTRQLQRKVAVETGFSPVLLKRIVRFQSVLSSGDYHLKFADQSHLIKEFKAVTGISYANFARKYIDVRKVQS